MKRVFARSLAIGILCGLMMYGGVRIWLAFSHRGDIRELQVFAAFMAIGGILFPVYFVVGLILLPAERRLVKQFALRDRSPHEPAYQRAVRICVSSNQFLNEMRVLIARSPLLSVTDDVRRVSSLRCKVRYGLSSNNFEVRINIEPDGGACITVRRIGILARFVPSEAGAANLLAGFLKWAADRRLIVDDFIAGDPEQFARDFSDWLPRANAWPPVGTECDEIRASPPTSRPKIEVPIRRIVGATTAGMAVFAVLSWLDRPGFPVPRVVQIVPICALLVYVISAISRAQLRSSRSTPHDREEP